MLGQSYSVPKGMTAVRKLLDGSYIPSVMIRESVMAHAYNEETARQQLYTQYREYYDGEHDTQLTDRIKAFLNFKTGDTDFNANYCPIVVDALAERLKLTGFDAGDQSETIWSWWRDNRMDAQQGVVHTGAVRDGDFYELVDWNNEAGRPEFSFELACADGDGVKVHYSKERRNLIEYASKRWTVDEPGTGKHRRLNLYFADHVEKYIGPDSTYEGSWRPYLEPAVDGRPAGVEQTGVFGPCGWYPWVSTDGKPLGVPVVHFKNRDQGYERGQSELHSVIPLQNARNKALIDLLMAADTSGFPMFTGTGSKFQNVTVAPGRFLAAEEPDAQFGRLEASDLKPMIDVNDHFALEIARVSRTPLSYFQNAGQHPAEGTLQQEEVGLVAKAEKCTTDFGNAWEDLMTVARRLHNAFGTGGKLDESQAISAQWKPLQTRNEMVFLQGLVLKKQLGVSDKMIWHEMGYDADQIAELLAAKLKNARVFGLPSVTPAGGSPNGETAPADTKTTPGAPSGGRQMPGAPGMPVAEMSRL